MNGLKMRGTHEASWVTISSDEYESLQATIETLADKPLMEQIRKSLADIEAGRVKKWDDFVREATSKKP